MKRLFEENTICRLCLRVDEKAYKINNTSHKTFIESIIKQNKNRYVLPDDLYVCYICKALLAKLFNFAQAVWNTQEIMCVLLNTRDMITRPMIDHIDRHNNGLNPITLSATVTYRNKTINNRGDDNDFQITKPMLNRIDRLKNGLNPITLSSILAYGNKTINNNGDDNDCNDDECTSTDIEEIETIDIIEIKSTDSEVESTDIGEVDLDILVNKVKKRNKNEKKCKKKKQKRNRKTKNHLGPNSSSDENEEGTVTRNFDEVEVEIDKIGEETSGIFAASLIEKACDNQRPFRTIKKPKRLIMQDITREKKTTKRLYPIEAKKACSTANEKECKKKSDEINEDYHHDPPSISAANENKCKKERDEIDKNHCHDVPSSSTANENKCKKESDEIDEDYRHDVPTSPTAHEKKCKKESDEIDEGYRLDVPSSSTANENKRKKISVEIDEDYCSDTTSSSTANENKRKKINDEIDYDYCPDSTSHSEDSEYDSYDDEGKAIRRPKDTRVYPMKCDHCNFVVPEKRNHYRHYQYVHPEFEYPYKMKEHVTCLVCGKLVARAKIRIHEEAHTNTKNFKCSLCPNKAFPNKVRLYKHVICVHPKKTFTCDYCSKVFKTKTDIHRHIRIHTGDKPFKCHICDEAFAHSGNRTIHIRIRHQNYKDKPKKKEKPKKKRRKNTKYSTTKEVYDTSDDEPLGRVATNPHNA